MLEIAAINAATAIAVLTRLERGTIDERLPALVGSGCWYGPVLRRVLLRSLKPDTPRSTVSPVGWRTICTTASSGDLPESELLARMASNKGVDHPYRPVFHYDDVSDDIVAEDLIGYRHEQTATFPYGRHCTCLAGRTSPRAGPLGINVVVDEAAAMNVPVLIANGEVDVCPDPRTEPAAYSSSTDITAFVLPRSGHMHNFAGSESGSGIASKPGRNRSLERRQERRPQPDAPRSADLARGEHLVVSEQRELGSGERQSSMLGSRGRGVSRGRALDG